MPVLANLPANHGLYSIVFSGFTHLLFGAFPFQSAGPCIDPFDIVAVVALMTGNAALSCAYALEHAGLSTKVDGDFVWQQYPLLIPLTEFVTFVVGILLLLFLFSRCGRYLDYFAPTEVIAGFTSAAVLAVGTSQLKGLFGISLPPDTGSFVVLKTYYGLFSKITLTKWISLVVGISTMALVYAVEYGEIPCYRFADYLICRVRSFLTRQEQSMPTRKYQSIIPRVLVAIIMVTLVTYLSRLDKLFGLAVLGSIRSGFPEPNLPWRVFHLVDPVYYSTIILNLLPNVLSLVLILLVTLKSIVQTFPVAENCQQDSDSVSSEALLVEQPAPNLLTDSPQVSETDLNLIETAKETNTHKQEETKYWTLETNEVINLSIANFACSIFSGFVVCGSLSRSAILATQTQASSTLANGVMAVVVMIVVFVFTNLAYFIPISCLSAVVLVALFSTAKTFKLGYDLFRSAVQNKSFDCIESFSLWICTFIGVVIFDPTIGIMSGIVVGIIFKALDKLRHKYQDPNSQKPSNIIVI
jgi:MFS superfamily sulfate permease-like transporter